MDKQHPQKPEKKNKKITHFEALYIHHPDVPDYLDSLLVALNSTRQAVSQYCHTGHQMAFTTMLLSLEHIIHEGFLELLKNGVNDIAIEIKHPQYGWQIFKLVLKETSAICVNTGTRTEINDIPLIQLLSISNVILSIYTEEEFNDINPVVLMRVIPLQDL